MVGDVSSGLRIVERVIDGGLEAVSRDDELDVMLGNLSSLCLLMKQDGSSTRRTFIAKHVYNLILESAQGAQREELKDTLEEKVGKWKSKLNEVDECWKEGVLHRKKEGNYKEKLEKIKFYSDKCAEYSEKMKVKEHLLKKLGFNDKLDGKFLKELENSNAEKKREIVASKGKLSAFKGVEPNNQALSRKIKEIREEQDQFESSFNRFSMD
ncbi:hypothetical protein HDE_07081 [Halotydeus destructor]|nr:hypothetical protein HDE_07081 [Halotydeus destructor]